MKIGDRVSVNGVEPEGIIIGFNTEGTCAIVESSNGGIYPVILGLLHIHTDERLNNLIVTPIYRQSVLCAYVKVQSRSSAGERLDSDKWQYAKINTCCIEGFQDDESSGLWFQFEVNAENNFKPCSQHYTLAMLTDWHYVIEGVDAPEVRGKIFSHE